MAFFGLTYLGAPSAFARTLHTKNINDFSDRTLRECYERTEKLQGKGTISIDEIRILLSYVYDGLPPEREIGLLTKYADLNSRGPQLPGEGAEGGILIRLTCDEFMRAVAQVRKDIEEAQTFKNIAGVKEVAHEFSSYEHLQEHAHKHLRSHYAPQDKYIKPVTSAQEIGWFTPAKVEQVDRRPNKSCEETLFAAKFHLLQ